MSCNSTVPSATLFEKGMYIGINLQDMLYGVELVLYFRTMAIFLARRGQPHKSDVFYAVFGTVMLILITIWVAALSTFGQKMWLLDRDYPGGPMAFHTANSSSLYMIFGRFSLAVLQQMADALMIYRCRIVWGSRRVVVVPSILWLANFGLGTVVLWTSSTPRTTFFSGIAAKLELAYCSSSTFLNVMLTSMICYQLLRHAQMVKSYLGGKHASPYITIVTIVIESVLPFTLSSIAFLVSYGMKSQSAIVFSFIHPLVMCVAPQMLMLRVARAKAWQKDESGLPASIIRFPSHHGDTASPGGSDRSGGVAQLVTLTNVHQQSGRGAGQV